MLKIVMDGVFFFSLQRLCCLDVQARSQNDACARTPAGDGLRPPQSAADGWHGDAESDYGNAR